ncbi:MULTISPECIES: ABC transporter ATP-binding protein [Acidobacteriaceae]|uniref:ABC transporter ATP-binding protein n=1 Tax=Acidobacteriaceae TaxID=204434 RepID=UPI00131C3A88|nr:MULTISPECIES: ABC transporter ATP-binding protein [Acidobacteriaceae]MDW5266032.1 ABC transporter ATP-binding protein [Edaphobacter sp.]
MAEWAGEIHGSLHPGGKSAASGRDDVLGGESEITLVPLPGATEATVVLRAEGLTKSYAAVPGAAGRGELELFRGLDLVVHAGEMVAIVGESGAGKSSLLHLLAALDRPTAGEVWCGESRLSTFSAAQAADFRNRDVGYVWQFHYLLPEFTALENVAMPLLARGMGRLSALKRARVWLSEVGLAERVEHRSGELSGGEQQRVSLARALVTEPKILLADEPTGDLDGKTAEAVFGLIQGLHTAHGLTSVIVTHSLEFAGRCGRMLRLREGRLVEVSD